MGSSFCDTCGEFKLFDFHECPARWTVSDGEPDGYEKTFHARGPEIAAEKAVSEMDDYADGADDHVAYSEGEVIVRVRPEGSDGPVSTFRVRGWMKPTYVAESVDEESPSGAAKGGE